MNNRPRFVVLMLLFAAFAFTPYAKASDDETATGVYSYVGQGLQIRFVLDLDGIRQLRIDQKTFKGPIQVSETQGGGGEKTYTFFIIENNISKTISLIVLFDTDSAVRAISGFYYEHKKGTETMTRALVIRPTFHRLSLDDLPSAKK